MSRPSPLSTLAALLATAGAAVMPAAPLAAQQPVVPDSAEWQLGADGAPADDRVQLVDRVVAVVGDTTILLSEVREELFRMQQAGLQIPSDPFARDSVMRSALNSLVEEAMLLEEAKRTGIQVPEEQISQLADDRFSRMRGNFESDQQMRGAVESTGQNMFQFRQMLRSRAWAELTLNRFRQQLVTRDDLPPASVSEVEIQTFFRQNAAGRSRPGNVTFDRVIVAPSADSVEADSALERARAALDEIQGGTDFAVTARRYSEDTTTREDGGDLGWIRRSDVVPGFGNAAWAAPAGRAVGPIRTRFGYHVVKVENVRGGERRVRHILIRPVIDDDDVAEARELAGSLADSLGVGADADRLARRYGLAGEQVRFEEIRLDELEGRLGDAYARALTSPSEGDVVGPFEVEGSYGLPNFVLLEVRDHVPTGGYRLEDVRERIRQQLMQQKQFDRYLTQLRDRMYVQVLVARS